MKKRRARPNRTALIATAIAAAAAAVVVAIIHWTGATAPPPVTIRPAAIEPGGKTRGKPDARVTIEVFSDFLCSHCADFAAIVEPALISEFVETGVVRLVHRHFPIVSPLSVVAAEASECAADQQRFWAYHDALFARAARGALRGGWDLDESAREIGLDEAAFAACRRSAGIHARVEADRADGERRGVRGTPTSFVNDRMIVGAQPLEVFRAAIESAGAR